MGILGEINLLIFVNYPPVSLWDTKLIIQNDNFEKLNKMPEC